MKNDENLGHKWRWNGDVKQCKCGMYLGVWDGLKHCPLDKSKKPNTKKQ